MLSASEQRLRKATIRVAARTRDPLLKRQLLRILKKAGGADVTARFPEGESVDVEEWLRSHGHPEAAKDWKKNNEKYKDKFKEAAAQTFPGLRKTAWHHVLSYCQRRPSSKLARASSAMKAAAADRMVERWVYSAVRQRRTAKYAQASKREITAAIKENGTANFVYPALLLAKELSAS